MSNLLNAVVGNNNDEIYEELRREYYENRILVLNDEIDDFVIDDFALWILKWNRDDKDVPVDKRRPIRLFISSPGGNTFSANILIDVILQSKTPIIGVGLDLVASAAYLIFLACHERVCFKNSVFLQHEGDMAIENSRSKFKQTNQFFEELENRAKDYILSRTKMTSEFYDSIYEVEYWILPDKAKELGVIHKVIGEDIDIDYVY